MEKGGRQHITLYKLQGIIKTRLEDAMPLPCWVTAEISEVKINYSGHCYLELVEKGGKNHVPKAKASAVIWRSSFGAISSYFKSATGLELTEGMNILMKVTVSYHELYGLSLVITDIDPLYTIGDMERQRQETIARLQEEGVFDINRSLDLGRVIHRIAVVSSRNAAGYQDFMNEISFSGYNFKITLFDAFMQGHAAEESIIEALGLIAGKMEEFDAVVMIRGGGSQSDLGAFDSYRLCCHIAQFPIPIITGIGHDKDESVADLVASVSLKTPTAVAAWLVQGMNETDNWLREAENEISMLAADLIRKDKQKIQSCAYILSDKAKSLTYGLMLSLEKLTSEVSRTYNDNLLERKRTLDNLSNKLIRHTCSFCTAADARLMIADQGISARNPEKILSMGFAIVTKNNKIVRSSGELEDGDIIDIQLNKGKIKAKTEIV